MKLTHKKFRSLIQELLNKFKINFTVTSSCATRYRSQDYEAGAYKINIVAQDSKGESYNDLYIYCGYSIKELEYYLNNGYQLQLLTPATHYRQQEWEIEIKK